VIDSVTRLIYPGLPNPRAAVPAESVDRINRILKDLPGPPPFAGSGRRGCWPPKALNVDTYLYAFADGRLAYVAGQDVDVLGERRWDDKTVLADLAVELLAGDLLSAGTCTVCDEGNLGKPLRCPCDGNELGLDLSAWHYTAPIIHNNCYSYARGKRWCEGGQGSQPGDRESGSEKEILAGLAADRLIQVCKSDLSDKGLFIGLFIEGSANYHFLRLDGDYWTHKFGGYPVAGCDADLKPIPRDGLESSAMLNFTFKDYFYVPPGVELKHCS
jgi:hypothetical protein